MSKSGNRVWGWEGRRNQEVVKVVVYEVPVAN